MHTPIAANQAAAGSIKARMRSHFRPTLAVKTPPPARVDSFFTAMPSPAPLDMEPQDLSRSPAASPSRPSGMNLRRGVILGGAAAIALIAGLMMLQVLRGGGLSLPEGLVIGLSTLLSGWIGLGFMTALAGFFATLRLDPAAADLGEAAPRGRTAILMPAYNEDPGMILSAVQAIAEDLARRGRGAAYDLFILSDTRDEAIAQAEAVGFLRLRSRLPQDDGPAVYYRRRVKNTDRKAGNIADWVRAWGGAYDYMLVLDADSVMSGETIVALSDAMDEDPGLGLLQTFPVIVNSKTPFARLQQFANRLYGPVFAMGHQWWAGSEGNYWGHNAILRVRAFAESAGLPHLTGPRPFGGHIMSHDFVEAALLRRRGWSVRMSATLPGSYEETPPTLLDMAARDRRWCQGNLQHIRLIGAAGLHWVSRLHLICGVFSYVAPALWLVLLLCGAAVWPAQHAGAGVASHEVMSLFGLTVALLVGPKLLALIAALMDARQSAAFGGRLRMTIGFLIESVASTLTAPVLMIMQTVAVVQVLLGRDSGWNAQRREGAELSPREAWRAHRGHVALGVLGALAALLVDRHVLFWTSPVFLGLALSSFLSLHTSRPSAGHGYDRHLVLQIPEERAPPPILVRCLELRRAYADEAAIRQEIDLLFRAPVPVYRAEVSRWSPLRFVKLAA